MNTRFNYCDRDLEFLAPPELFKDIDRPKHSHADPSCFFFVRGSEEKTAKKASNGNGYSFDLNGAREICKRYVTTVHTIRNDEERYETMKAERAYAFGAKMRFLRNEKPKFSDERSVWEAEKWDDDIPSVFTKADFHGTPHAGTGDDDEAVLLYINIPKDKVNNPHRKGFFVLQSHESVKDKILFYCKQNMTTLKYHYPVWPMPALSDEDELKPGTKQVDVCEEKPDGLKTRREPMDRCCYFQIPDATDKVNFQFQPGYYRFLFQRARAMCQEYVSSTLLTIQEIHGFGYIEFLLDSDEFYAVGVTLKRVCPGPISISMDSQACMPNSQHSKEKHNFEIAFQIEKDRSSHKYFGDHYSYWKIKKWDKSDSFDGWPHILVTAEFRAIYHPDDDDAAGLIFYKPDQGSRDWYVLQNSVGIRKKVQFLCKQEIAAGKKIVANNRSQPTDRWGSSSSNGVSKKTTGNEQPTKQSSIEQRPTNDHPIDSSSSRHAPVDRQGQSPAPPSKHTSSPRIPADHHVPSPSPPPRNMADSTWSRCQGFIALITSPVFFYLAGDY